MAMTCVWTGMVVLSLVAGLACGRLDAVANAALEGAQSAIQLSLSMAGILCLWTFRRTCPDLPAPSAAATAKRLSGYGNSCGNFFQYFR